MGAPRIVGRYALHGEIAAGGMATVHLGRLMGSGGVHRLVAIKRLHAQFAKDPEFVTMFLDEGRLSARIHHPNVVSVLDFLALEGELFLVMEYVQGEALSGLIKAAKRRGQPIPTRIASSIVMGLLQGLHAAHTAKSERGEPLHIVHRDVSPQNVLVSVDGVARVLDFGVAKATGRLQTTREGHIKGKIAYMAPEQIRSEPVDHRADVYGAAVVLYETLVGRRLYDGDNEGALLRQIVLQQIEPPSKHAPHLDPRWDAIVMKGLASDPADRYPTAEAFADAIEAMGDIATNRAVGQWVQDLAIESLAKRAAKVQQIEESGEAPDGSPTIASMLTPSARARAMADERSVTPGSSSSGGRAVPAATNVGAMPVDSELTARAASMSGPASSLPEPRGRGSKRIAWIAAGILITGAAVSLAVLLKGRGADGPATAAAAPLSATAGASASIDVKRAGEGPIVTPSPIVPSTETAAPAASPSAATSSNPTPSAKTTAPSRPTGATPQPPVTQPPPVTKPTGKNPACANPYVVDANGDMKIKRECL